MSLFRMKEDALRESVGVELKDDPFQEWKVEALRKSVAVELKGEAFQGWKDDSASVAASYQQYDTGPGFERFGQWYGRSMLVAAYYGVLPKPYYTSDQFDDLDAGVQMIYIANWAFLCLLVTRAVHSRKGCDMTITKAGPVHDQEALEKRLAVGRNRLTRDQRDPIYYYPMQEGASSNHHSNLALYSATPTSYTYDRTHGRPTQQRADVSTPSGWTVVNGADFQRPSRANRAIPIINPEHSNSPDNVVPVQISAPNNNSRLQAANSHEPINSPGNVLPHERHEQQRANASTTGSYDGIDVNGVDFQRPSRANRAIPIINPQHSNSPDNVLSIQISAPNNSNQLHTITSRESINSSDKVLPHQRHEQQRVNASTTGSHDEIDINRVDFQPPSRANRAIPIKNPHHSNPPGNVSSSQVSESSNSSQFQAANPRGTNSSGNVVPIQVSAPSNSSQFEAVNSRGPINSSGNIVPLQISAPSNSSQFEAVNSRGSVNSSGNVVPIQISAPSNSSHLEAINSRGLIDPFDNVVPSRVSESSNSSQFQMVNSREPVISSGNVSSSRVPESSYNSQLQAANPRRPVRMGKGREVRPDQYSGFGMPSVPQIPVPDNGYAPSGMNSAVATARSRKREGSSYYHSASGLPSSLQNLSLSMSDHGTVEEAETKPSGPSLTSPPSTDMQIIIPSGLWNGSSGITPPPSPAASDDPHTRLVQQLTSDFDPTAEGGVSLYDKGKARVEHGQPPTERNSAREGGVPVRAESRLENKGSQRWNFTRDRVFPGVGAPIWNSHARQR